MPEGPEMYRVASRIRRTLADAVCEMMWRSARSGGITNDPERAERLKAAG